MVKYHDNCRTFYYTAISLKTINTFTIISHYFTSPLCSGFLYIYIFLLFYLYIYVFFLLLVSDINRRAFINLTVTVIQCKLCSRRRHLIVQFSRRNIVSLFSVGTFCLSLWFLFRSIAIIIYNGNATECKLHILPLSFQLSLSLPPSFPWRFNFVKSFETFLSRG